MTGAAPGSRPPSATVRSGVRSGGGPACTVCGSPARQAVDAGLISGIAMARLAREHGLGVKAISRHRQHVGPALARARRAHEQTGPASAIDRTERLYAAANAILEQATTGGHHRLALEAIGRLRGIVELYARLTGELRDGPIVEVNLLGSPEWLAIRQAVLEALASHPDARQAVAAHLAALEPTWSGP